MKFTVFLLLAALASSAIASSIKGYTNQRSDEGVKGHRAPFSPIEQQRLIEQRAEATKGRAAPAPLPEQKLEKLEQLKVESEPLKQEPYQQEQLKEEKYEQQQQQQQQQLKLEEPTRAEAESKGQTKYEAKPQLNREELAKSQKLAEEYPAKGASPKSIEQQKIQQEELKVEQQRELLPAQQKEERYEQQYQEPQVELKQEEQQRRLEEPVAFVQPIPPLGIVETRAEQLPVVIEQQRYEAIKGREYIQAPLAEAEPYAFDYQIEGQSRRESGDTKGVVRGQYTLQGADGSSRVVDYIADHNGFRASVNTNEFGTEAKSPASIALASSQPTAEDITLRLAGKTKEDFLPQQAPTLLAVASRTSSAYTAQAPLSKTHRDEHYQAPLRGGQDWALKSQKLAQQHEDTLSVQEQAPKGYSETSRVTKSEQYAATAPAADLTRAGFESATAHRAYSGKQQQTLAAPATAPAPAQRKLAPTMLVRQLSAPLPVKGPVYAPVSRAYVRPTTAHAQNPRVSFYSSPATGPINYDEEIPSFIEPEQA